MENELGITGLGGNKGGGYEEGVEDGQVSAPPEEGQGLETPAGDTPDYAGYKSVEELVAAHQKTAQEKADLESLKGRMGNELGSVRSEKIRLEGMIEALKSQPTATIQTTSLKELQEKLDDEEITVAEYIEERDKVVRQELETKFNKTLDEKLGSVNKEWKFEKYKEKFIKDNPGYEEAFDSGALDKWIYNGIPGETAWDKFQLEKLSKEKTELENKIKTTSSQAHSAGVQTGIKIESGKKTAGKVLGTEGVGSFSQGSQAKPLAPHERTAAAKEYLNRMRGTA